MAVADAGACRCLTLCVWSVCLVGCPVCVPVIDVCQVSVQPPARSVPVNCPAVTRIVTAAAGEAELVVNIRCTSAQIVTIPLTHGIMP